MQSDDKMSPVPESEQIFVTGGHETTWFLTGERQLTMSAGTVSGQPGIVMYPNPASNVVRITPIYGLENFSLKLYDSQGRLLQARVFQVTLWKIYY